MIPPSPLDLATLSSVKQWIPGPQPADNATVDAVLQRCITSVSLDFLRRTGRGPANQSIPTQSPFAQGVQYSENYDGNGNNRMYVKNAPILSIQSLTISGYQAQPATSNSPVGYQIDNGGKSIVLLNNSIGYPAFATFPWNPAGVRQGQCFGFPIGIQNISVTYTAGYAAQAIANELRAVPTLPGAWAASTAYSNGATIFDGVYIQTATIIGPALSQTSQTSAPAFSQVPGSVVTDGKNLTWTNSGLPYQLTANVLPWLGTTAVNYFSSGNPLTQVFTAPAAGQYFIVSPGVYMFAAGDAGAQILLSYTASGCPSDIEVAVCQIVYETFKKRGWAGLKSQSQKDIGSTTYGDWVIPREAEAVVKHYRRAAIV